MGLLNPALLVLGIAVAVPILLHLLQRHQGPRVIFPALRYLRRAEREHARRIRLRQLLLLALRVAALLLLALAAARPFLRSGGVAHRPTAVAIVIDNSLSSGAVVGETRLLDLLKARALETLAAAGPDDRFWLLRAGSSWEPALPGDAAATAARVRETRVSASGAAIGAALARGRSLLIAGAEGRPAEIHLLSDLQPAGFAAAPPTRGGNIPVVIWSPEGKLPTNRGVAAVEVGGGLAPRAGERTTIAATLAGNAGADSAALRLVLDGRTVGAATATPGATALIPFPGRAAGLVSGWVEADADALRGDDRRYFAARVQPPPTVAVNDTLAFLREAAQVLADAGRIRLVAASAADVVIAPAALGAEAARAGRTAVVFAPATPLELPAANQRLLSAGISWRYSAPREQGEARLEVDTTADAPLRAMADVRIRQLYPLQRQGATGGDSVLLRLRDGTPFLVRGELPSGGRYLILAAAMTPEASTLPTSAAMLPLLDRLVGAWAAGEAARADAAPGEAVPLPSRADAVERPDGSHDRVEGGSRYRAPGEPGVYRILRGSEVLGAFAVNPPAAESELGRLAPRRLRSALDGWEVELVDDADDWTREIYRTRLGREAWRLLALLALAVLMAESFIAASGAVRRPTAGGTSRSTRGAPQAAGPELTAPSVAGGAEEA